MDAAEIEKLTTLLSTGVLRQNLAKAAVYLVGYEMLKDALIEQPKRFFTSGRPGPHTDYQQKVLALHKSRLIASCMWLRDSGALTDEDIAAAHAIRKHRTDIAHEMPNVLLNPSGQVDEARLLQMYTLLEKVDRWWAFEVEIPSNSDFDGEEVDPGQIKSGRVQFLELLLNTMF